MLNITHHQGNANQNHDEVLASHLLEWQLPKSQEMTSFSCNSTTVLLGSFQIVWSLLADGSYMQQFIMCNNIYMQTCAWLSCTF